MNLLIVKERFAEFMGSFDPNDVDLVMQYMELAVVEYNTNTQMFMDPADPAPSETPTTEHTPNSQAVDSQAANNQDAESRQVESSQTSDREDSDEQQQQQQQQTSNVDEDPPMPTAVSLKVEAVNHDEPSSNQQATATIPNVPTPSNNAGQSAPFVDEADEVEDKKAIDLMTQANETVTAVAAAASKLNCPYCEFRSKWPTVIKGHVQLNHRDFIEDQRLDVQVKEEQDYK